MRVVIADDDDDIRALVEIAVRRQGFDVVAEVADGAHAWAAIQTLRPDLAVLDWAMPGMSGLEVCRRTRSHPALHGIRLVLLTAAADRAAEERGRAAGADEYVIKPFTLPALAQAMVADGSAG
jgi:DNA-binding response OmpR family regulator